MYNYNKIFHACEIPLRCYNGLKRDMILDKDDWRTEIRITEPN